MTSYIIYSYIEQWLILGFPQLCIDLKLKLSWIGPMSMNFNTFPLQNKSVHHVVEGYKHEKNKCCPFSYLCLINLIFGSSFLLFFSNLSFSFVICNLYLKIFKLFTVLGLWVSVVTRNGLLVLLLCLNRIEYPFVSWTAQKAEDNFNCVYKKKKKEKKCIWS